MSARIHVTAGPDQGKVFALQPDKPNLIGRGQDADIQVNDLSVSRAHCHLSFRDNELVIIDSGSRSGLFLNGQRVQEQAINSGDVVKIGNTEFRIEHTLAGDTVPPDVARAQTQAKPVPQMTRARVDGDGADGDEGLPELPSERMNELIGQVLNQYQLGPVLAKAQSGMVFMATDTRDGRKVALKLLWAEFARDDAEVQRFIRAMKTMLPIKHPNLITILAAGKTGPYCWIAMEYVQGKSVAQILEAEKSAGQLDWQRALRVAVHVSRGLVFAHHHSIVHRNVTPQNILIGEKDQVAKLGDLMLAKAMEGKMAKQITADGHLLGDLRYMAPERTSGLSGEIDERSDLYALGATVYALLTGKPPIEGKSMMETILKIRQEKPVSPRGVQPKTPPEFEQIIMKSLEKEPEQRFQKASDMLAALEKVAKAQSVAC